MKQGIDVDAFYRSRPWLNKRNDILARDNGECQKCKRRGKFARAECVHHIQHLKDRPDLALDDSNLIGLCGPCHNQEHPEKLRKKNIIRKVITKERW